MEKWIVVALTLTVLGAVAAQPARHHRPSVCAVGTIIAPDTAAKAQTSD